MFGASILQATIADSVTAVAMSGRGASGYRGRAEGRTMTGSRVTVDASVKRGPESWAYIYTVLGFVLTIREYGYWNDDTSKFPMERCCVRHPRCDYGMAVYR
jgi:hypothetical protein